MKWLHIFALYIEEKWNTHKLYKSMSTGNKPSSTVNISVFNTVVNGWSKLRYFQVISAKYAGIKNIPILIDIAKLSLNKTGIHNGAYLIIFKNLIRSWQGVDRILPWNAVLHPDTFDEKFALNEIVRLCAKYKSRVEPWIAQFKDYNATKLNDLIDNIDGKYVSPMTQNCVDFLKSKDIFT